MSQKTKNISSKLLVGSLSNITNKCNATFSTVSINNLKMCRLSKSHYATKSNNYQHNNIIIALYP